MPNKATTTWLRELRQRWERIISSSIETGLPFTETEKRIAGVVAEAIYILGTTGCKRNGSVNNDCIFPLKAQARDHYTDENILVSGDLQKGTAGGKCILSRLIISFFKYKTISSLKLS